MRRVCAGFLSMVFLMALFLVPRHGEAQQVNGEALDVMLALDNSRSMIKNDPKLLSRALVKNFIQSLPEGIACGMVVFGQKAKMAVPLTLLSGNGAVETLFSGLKAVDYTDNFTDIPAGIERALYELLKNGRPESRKVIVFLTDGIVDTGDRQEDARKKDWLLTDITAQCRKSGVRVFGVAFTEDADYQLIQSIAERTGGGYHRALAPEEIGGIFREILTAALAPDEEREREKTAETENQAAGTPAPPFLASVAPAAPAQAPETTESDSWQVLAGGIVLAAILGVVLVAIRRRYNPKSVIRKRDSVILGDPSRMGLPSVPRAELIPLSGTPNFLPIIIRDPITRIGRKKGNEVVIENPAISRFHAVIEYKEGVFYIEDQNSANKTIINDKPISPHTGVRLESGMTVAFDTVKYRFIRPDTPYGDESFQDDDPADRTLFHPLGNVATPSSRPKAAAPPQDAAKAAEPAPPTPSPDLAEIPPVSPSSGESPVALAKTVTIGEAGSHETSPSFSPARIIEEATPKPSPSLAGANVCPWHPDRFATQVCPKCKKPCCDKCMTAKDGVFMCPACQSGD